MRKRQKRGTNRNGRRKCVDQILLEDESNRAKGCVIWDKRSESEGKSVLSLVFQAVKGALRVEMRRDVNNKWEGDRKRERWGKRLKDWKSGMKITFGARTEGRRVQGRGKNRQSMRIGKWWGRERVRFWSFGFRESNSRNVSFYSPILSPLS